MNIDHNPYSLQLIGSKEHGLVFDEESLNMILQRIGTVNPCRLFAYMTNGDNTVLTLDHLDIVDQRATVTGLTALVNNYLISTDSLHVDVNNPCLLGISVKPDSTQSQPDRVGICLPDVHIKLISSTNKNDLDMPLASVLSENGRLIIDPYFFPPLYSIRACQWSGQAFDLLMNQITRTLDIPRLCLQDSDLNWPSLLRFVYNCLSKSFEKQISEQNLFKYAWQQDNHGHCVKYLIRCLDIWRGLPWQILSQDNGTIKWIRRQWIWPDTSSAPYTQLQVVPDNGREHALFMRLTTDAREKATVEILQNGRSQIAVLTPGEKCTQKNLTPGKNVTLNCMQQESNNILAAYYTTN